LPERSPTAHLQVSVKNINISSKYIEEHSIIDIYHGDKVPANLLLF